MSRRLLLAALLALALAPAGLAQTEPDHTFQIRNGEVYFDGQLVPDAVPDHLDLAGLGTGMLEMVGDVVPALEVDGVWYVFENGQLVQFKDSSRAGSMSLYALPEIDASVAAIPPADRMTPVVEGAYLREVAERNQALYDRMQREHQMEVEAYGLAEQIRALPDGPEKQRLSEELRGRLSDLLTLKQEVLNEEILFVQARLDVLRSRLEERDARHGEIVDLRLRQLIGEE